MPQKTTGFRPQLEALEDRQLMATQVSFDTSQTVMYLVGDKRVNQIDLFDNGSGGFGNITGTVDGVDLAQITATRRIRRIVVDTGKGNDIVNYTLATPNNQVVNGSLGMVVRLGDGHDRFAASVDNVNLVNSYFDIQVYGGKGNDQINASAANTNLIQASQLNFNFQGEDGNDLARANWNGFIDTQGVLRILADGGRGNDTVSIESRVQSFSLGQAQLETRGGLGFDRLDLISRADGPLIRTRILATLDGGTPPDFGLARHFYKQWEDITLTGMVELKNVDPRSRINYILS